LAASCADAGATGSEKVMAMTEGFPLAVTLVTVGADQGERRGTERTCGIRP
jgi:hypothetical protein